MAKLAFRNHDQAAIAAQLEAALREEVGAATPVPYEIRPTAPVPGALLGEIYRAAFGGRGAPNRLCTQELTLSHPRPGTLVVDVNKAGIGAYAGSLVYSAPIGAVLASPVQIDAARTATFSGDLTAAGRLNADAGLRKEVSGFLRKSLAVSGTSLHITPTLHVLPAGDHALVVAHTLPKPVKLGLAMSLNAQAWFSIVGAVEAALQAAAAAPGAP